MDSEGDFVGDYEVFLSFRGKDTRQGFTDILYEYMTMADIRVFRDDDELAIGDKIESILDAINMSKICIPVFSPNFAESKWCLREVSRMVELKKMIVPVFYKVSPNDVKLKKTSVYVDDFIKLQQNHEDPVEIVKWKKSLEEAASNKGRELGYMRYTQFCKELVNEVLTKLGPRTRLDVDHFVGDTNKAEAIKLLNMGSSSKEVIYLGIHGMGGIGKTTVTKLIYNEFLSSFDYCGFLPDIREFSANKGVDCLPTYLCENLQPKFVTPFSRSQQIPNIFKNKKVLIILDDVDRDEQIRKIAEKSTWFGSGSRIIVTSRDKKVFEEYKAVSRCEIQYLEMKELECGWSLELFSKCAFGKPSPPSSYQDLAKRVVAYAGGLPLTITVISKYLRNEKEEIWEEIIERLKRTPPKEVNARLLISYASLDNEQKNIFLDIACIFNNYIYSEKSYIFHMWQACGLYPRWSLEVLQSRSLVKVIHDIYCDYGEFSLQIHDQLRDLGRDIVITKSGQDLTKQSRFWKHDEVVEILKRKEKEKNMIEAIGLDLPETFRKNKHGVMVFTDEEFISFDYLRYLDLSYKGLKLKGDFSNLLPKLSLLQCDGDVLEVRNLAPPNLVILDLSRSNGDENWDGWSQLQVLKKLKTLDLSECRSLRRTPVFSENMPLEILHLRRCYELEYIDASIGKLQHLIELTLDGCEKLEDLPESCGELHSLRELSAMSVSITSLPESIGRLEKLENLQLYDTKFLVELPQSFGNLHSLRELNLGESILTSLPNSITRLEKLENLDLCSVQLQELPKLPSSLKVLDIECYGLNRTPDLSNLQDLTSLTLSGTRFNLLGSKGLSSSSKMQDLNIGLLSMSRLLKLYLTNCEGITDIPDIGKLKSLTFLGIYDCPFLISLVNLGKLKELRTLVLNNCPRLAGIPGVDKLRRLTKLYVLFCDSLELIDDISELEEFKELHLNRVPKLSKIPGLANLRKLRLIDVQFCKSRGILEVASQLKKVHGVEVWGIPKSGYVDNVDGSSDSCELQRSNVLDQNDVCGSLDQLENIHASGECSRHLDFDMNLDCSQGLNSYNEEGNSAINQLENLLGEVEGNNRGNMQRLNLGGSLATDQGEIEDLPPRNRKRNRFDSPDEGRRKLRLYGVDICDESPS